MTSTSNWGDPDFGGNASVAAALTAMPLLVEVVDQYQKAKGDSALTHLRKVVAHHPEVVLASLDRLSMQLVQYMAAFGAVSRTRLLAREIRDGDPARIDERIERLVTLGVALVEDLPVPSHDGDEPTVHTTVSLREQFASMVPLPLPLFFRAVDTITVDRLRQACRLLGAAPNGTRKADLALAILGVMLNAERLVAAVAAAHPLAAEVFAAVIALSLSDASKDPEDRYDEMPGLVPTHHLWTYLETESTTLGYADRNAQEAFAALQQRLLIGSEGGTTGWGAAYASWTWLEVRVAMAGHMFASWAERDEPTLLAIDEPTGVAAHVVAATSVVTRRLAAEAVEAKKSGDRHPPVKAVRRAGSEAAVPARLAELVTDAAIDIGLLIPVDVAAEKKGRGRPAPPKVHWVLDPERFDEWTALSPGARWLCVVKSWLQGSGNDRWLIGTAGARLAAISALAMLPDGEGVGAAEFDDWMHEHHAVWTYGGADVVGDLALLGVIGSGPVVGLGRAGRAMLGQRASATTTPDALDEELAGEPSFVVQPDHTIIAPAAVPVDVLEVLVRIAEVDSAGAAVVWRISTDQLARSADELDAPSVLEFLDAHSSVPVPDNVARLIRDHLVSAGATTIQPIASLVRCADPTMLSTATAVKAAQLQLVAPGIAVSALDPAKVRDALRAKGVATDLLGVDGTPAAQSATAAATTPNGNLARSWMARTDLRPGPLRPPAPVVAGPAIVADLAKR